MSTEDVLIRTYGPLMTMSQVAHLLDRSQEGLRLTVRGNSDLGLRLMAARVKIGRRVHFRAKAIADLIDGCSDQVGAVQ